MQKLFELIFSLLENSLRFLFEFAETVFGLISKKNKGYHAEFASQGTLLSNNYNGFCLTGQRNLSVKNSYQNALCVGGTGTGKSSVVLLPSIFTMQSSLIIHDPSGELFTKSAGYLKHRGYEIKVLNFANPNVSCGYNPLARAKSSSDIQKIASMLVSTAMGGNSKDPFWNTQGVSLLAMLITILKKQDIQYQNLYNVRQLLNKLGGSPKDVDALFSRDADEVLYSEYKSFISYDEKVISGVISTAKAALQIFSDESVAKVTATDNLNMEDFRLRPTALFIQNSVADQKFYSVLTSIFFEQFFSYTLSRFPAEKEQDIFFLVDEASSLKLPTLPLAVANVRKHRSGIMLIVQDYNQLVHNYGKFEADAIKSNCFAKIYFTGQSLETSRELEQTLGRFEYIDKEGKKNIEPLMTNDQVRTMKLSRALFICGHHKPILAKLEPYYKRRKHLEYSLIPPPDITNGISVDVIPILPLPVNSEKN